jgi:hypothetical protein
MKFSTLFILFVLSLTFNIQAQEKPDAIKRGESASVSENLVKIETFYPSILGVSYEKKISQNIALYSMLGFFGYGGGGTFSQAIYGASPFYVLLPQLTLQPRFYHNLSKRAAEDKNTNYNSANYVGLTARVYHESYFISNAERFPKGPATLDLMLSYGMQRNFFKRMNFDGSICKSGEELFSSIDF